MQRRHVKQCKGEAEHTLVLGLEVVEELGQSIRLNSEILDDNARASDDAAGVSLLVENAESGPLTELLVVWNLDEVDAVLIAESLDQAGVGWLVVVGGEDAKVGLTLVEGLNALVESAGESVVDEGLLEDLLEDLLDVELSGWNVLNVLSDLNILNSVVTHLR